MIVLEGPDGAGKSTLFEKLRPVFREYEFAHSGGPVRSSLDLGARMTQQHARQVRDRHFCISEPIYGKFFNRPNLIVDSVINNWLQHRPFVIFCFAPDNALSEQKGEHDTPEHAAGVAANHPAIVSEYQMLATRGDLPYPCVVYRWVNYDLVVKAAMDHEKGFM